jgi:hypothetical protein
MRKRLVPLLLGLAVLAGCAAGMQYRQTGPTYPPRGSTAEIALFDRVEPPQPYERLGEINWEYHRRKFTQPRLIEILPELKEKAREVGGDALVVRKLEEPANPEGTLKLVADVVRWKR